MFWLPSRISLYDKHSLQCPLSIGSAWGWRKGDLGPTLFEPLLYINSDVLRQLTLSRITLSGKEIHNLFGDFFISLLQEINETLSVSKKEIATTDKLM